MMRVAVVLGALALAGCGKAAGPPVAVDASQVESMIYFAHDLEGRRVPIDGYLSLDNGPDGQGIAMNPRLTSAPNGAGETTVPFQLRRGTGPNQMNLPVIGERGFGDAPIKIQTVDMSKATYQDEAGAAHPFGDRVRVSGKLRYQYVQTYYQSEADARSPSGRRYKPLLTDVTLSVPAG